MQSKQTLNITTLLHRCHQVEAAMAQVYQALALAHGHDAELCALWRKTAKEEENHGMQFQLALNLGKDAIHDVPANAARIERALAEVRAYLTRIQQTPPTVEQALRDTIAMEKEMVDLHVSSVAIFEKDSHRKLFRAMMAADKAHVEALQAALARIEARRR